MHLRDYGMIVNRSVWVIMVAALAVCIYSCGDPGQSGTGMDKKSYSRAFVLCSCIAVYAAVFIMANPVNYLRVIRCAAAVMMMSALLTAEGGLSCGRRILIRFRDIVTVLAAISLFCWVFGSVFDVFHRTGFVEMDWSQTGGYVKIPTLLGIYFETQWTDWALVNARNTGMFVEAPMAGCVYSIALLSEFMSTEYREWDTSGNIARVIRISILTTAILTTLSIICYGYLILLLAAGLIVRRSRAKQNSGRRDFIPVLIVCAGTAVVAFFVVNKLQDLSGHVRFNDFVVGYHAWLAHPFFGGGFESLEYLQQFMPSWRSFDTGFSNSPMEILAQGGIYLALPYIYAFLFTAAAAAKRRNAEMFMAVTLFAYLFIFIVIPYQYITFFILIILVRETRSSLSL